MEGSHCKLCTRLAYGLSGDYTDGFSYSYRVSVCKRRAVALGAYSVLCGAGENGADLYRLSAGIYYLFRVGIVDELISRYEQPALRVLEVLDKISSHKSFLEGFYLLLALAYLVYLNALRSSAVLHPYDDFL